MKKMTKKASALAAGVVSMGLLLGASTAQANVVLEGNNVVRIDNLQLNFDQDELDGFYNVEFINGQGSSPAFYP